MNPYTYEQSAGFTLSGAIPVILAIIIAAAVVMILGVYIKHRLDIKRKHLMFLRNRSIPGIISNLRGEEFEIWTQQLFLSIGAKAKVTGGQGDHGVDVVVQYNGKTIGVQCKKYSGLVGEPAVRDLYGVKWHNRFDKVILITTGNFSWEALAWAKGKNDLVLINARLLEKIIMDKEVLKSLIWIF